MNTPLLAESFGKEDLAELLFYMNNVLESKSNNFNPSPESSQTFTLGNQSVTVTILTEAPSYLHIQDSSAVSFGIIPEFLKLLNSSIQKFYVRLGSTDKYKTYFQVSKKSAINDCISHVRGVISRSS